MMLDVCLEVSGSYAHLLGVDTVNSLFGLRDRRWRRAGRNPAAEMTADVAIDGFEARLSAALDRLPLLLAHVLWLVDVCGCTYQTAAAELGTSPERVQRLVAQARRQLRDELVGDGVTGRGRSPAGSTSRSRPASPRQGH